MLIFFGAEAHKEFCEKGDYSKKKKSKIIPSCGPMSKSEKTILVGTLKGKIARWSQVKVPTASLPALIAKEFAEMWLEGYCAQQIKRLWFSTQRQSYIFETGLRILDILSQAVGPKSRCVAAPRASVETSIALTRFSENLARAMGYNGGGKGYNGGGKGTGTHQQQYQHPNGKGGGRGGGGNWQGNRWNNGQSSSVIGTFSGFCNRLADAAFENQFGNHLLQAGLGSVNTQPAAVGGRWPNVTPTPGQQQTSQAQALLKILLSQPDSDKSAVVD